MKLICAPMATLSHPAFRIMIEKFGSCDEYYNEMINAPSLLHGGQFEKFYINPAPCPEKLVWQLTGKSAEPMIKAAALLCDLGGMGIDLNMGCSAPEIYNSGAGSAWMVKPATEIEELLIGVRRVLSEYEEKSGKHLRFSVKCRLGDENFTDESFFSFAELLVKNGVERITLHPRTRKERYRDRPRWIYAQRLAEKYPELSVIVNGDVKDRASYEEVTSICPSCHGVMIGRMAAQKPWIFDELKNTGRDEKKSVDLLQTGLDFIDDVVKYQPPEFYKTRLQRFFAYYCDNFSFAHYAKTQMLNSKDVEDSKKRLIEYFEKVPADRYRISY